MNELANQTGSPFYLNQLGSQLGSQLAGMRPGQAIPWSERQQVIAAVFQEPAPKIQPSIQEQMESDVREWLSDWDK